VAVQSDVSKAFDMVPQQIKNALCRKIIPKYIVKLIRDSCEDVTTKIKQGTVEVSLQIRQGVKQGDPLFPFIFNNMLDLIILQLENQQGYKINDHCKVSSLAFADDIILVASDVSKARGLLENTEEYLKALGM
jgi:hypothetical protein